MARKKKDAVQKTFSVKTLKSGGYSLVLCAVVVVIAVLINMIIGALPTKITEPDISANSLFTLSDYSVQIAKGLRSDVTVYHLKKSNSSDNYSPYITRLLDRYTEISDHIKVEERDPEISQIATQYTKDKVSENSLIIVSEKRSKVVSANAIFGFSEDAVNAYYTYGSADPDEFHGEQEITSALSYVTSDVLPIVYALTGHGEAELSDSIVSSLSSQNMELQTLNLTTSQSIPEDCSCLMIFGPTVDITDKELAVIQNYLDQGGRLLAAVTDEAELQSPTPNFNALMQDCGVLVDKGYLMETANRSYFGISHYLLPFIDSHEITDPIAEKNYSICFPVCANLKKDTNARSELTITTLLHTSDDAYARTDLENQSQEKADGDISGPFDTAFAVTAGEGDTEMRTVIFATPYFLDERMPVLTGNTNLLLNSLKWMCDLEENISVVDMKPLTSGGYLEVSDTIAPLWMVILTLALPGAVLCVGIVIFVRRKKR